MPPTPKPDKQGFFDGGSELSPAQTGLIVLLLLAVFAAGVAILGHAYGLAVVAGGFAAINLGFFALLSYKRATAQGLHRMSEMMLGNEPVPCLVATVSGRVCYANPPARHLLDAGTPSTVTTALECYFAEAAEVFAALTQEALMQGRAQKQSTSVDGRQTLQVQQLNETYLLWRFGAPFDAQDAAELWNLPFLRIGKGGTIRLLNRAAREFLRGQPQHIDEISNTPIGRGVQSFKVGEGARSAAVLPRKTGEQEELILLPVEDTASGGTDERSMFESLPVAVLKLGKGGAILQANQFGRDLLALSSETRTLPDALEGLGRPIADWVDEAIGKENGTSSEVLRVRRDDKELYLQVALRRAQKMPEGEVIAVLNDATELKRLEAQFNQSQKMQAIGQLAGGVAHDFNNLLTAISGHCDLLLLRRDEGHPDFGDLMQIHQNANRAAALVEQLLAFSRKQTLRPRRVDLRDTLQDLTHLLDRLTGAPIRVSVHHDSAPASIWVDRRQFEQVIMNLVVNARDAMPDGGEIQISTSVCMLKKDLQRDRVRVPAGEYVVISVQDEGVGIPDDQLDKIFDPFFTTKVVGKGTGLGLSMVYGIVKQSGGYVFVDSTGGEGTRFTMYFPLRADEAKSGSPASSAAQDGADIAVQASLTRVKEARRISKPRPPARPAAVASSEGPSTGAGVVLLVEDEAPVRAFAARALSLRGYTVLEADSAEAALDVLRETAAQIDLFVTDVVMPGDDGPTWVRKARKQYPNTRVVFMSGYAEEVFAHNRNDIAQSVFLQKPFSLVELTNAVKEQIDLSRAG